MLRPAPAGPRPSPGTGRLALALALTCAFACAGTASALPQTAPSEARIVSVTRARDGRLRFEVASTPDVYFVLHRSRDVSFSVPSPVAIRLGEARTTTIQEPLGANGPGGFYRIVQHRRDNPADTDGDGLHDLAELATPIALSPLNPAKRIDFRHGCATLPDRETFKTLSYQGDQVAIDTHLKGIEFVKFQIEKADTAKPELFFINTVTHRSHPSFMSAVGIAGGGRPGSNSGTMRGVMIHRPLLLAANGEPGLYTIEFEPNDSFPFERIQLAHELVAANAPFLANNLGYYPLGPAIARAAQERNLYANSRIPVVYATNLYQNIGFLPLNLSQAFGRLRLMGPNDRPSARDIVLFTSLPNELSRVAGIITEVPQTPLSHVNLRAIQDNAPNAFISGASKNDRIAPLIGRNVFFRVDADGFQIREASVQELDAYFAALRPSQPQTPPRDLSITNILPFSAIQFGDADRFGVKAANLAAMRKPAFGFPDSLVPDGFAVPFHFYDDFMKFNGFYAEAAALLADPAFQSNIDVQEARLDDLRERIEDGAVPAWMETALDELHARYPAGTPLRCRSSTNNEDLPGFSGAGLYDSFTHHPDEGRLSKSIKQVFASLWNFRAWEEREFYRIDHLAAAMGVVVYPHYDGELANGVAVTRDPIYQSTGNYYVNAQLGEDLVTNPEALSVPEEVLLSSSGTTVTRIRYSNLVPDGTPVVPLARLNELRGHLTRIQSQFRLLYGVPAAQPFAMEIEFKVTKDGLLAIKQARPWLD